MSGILSSQEWCRNTIGQSGQREYQRGETRDLVGDRRLGRARLGNNHRTTYPKISRRGRTADRETRLGRSVGPCKTYGFSVFYPGPGRSGSPREAPPQGLRGIRVRTARCDVTRMWIHISRCGSTFPNVDPHLEIWIHIRCDTYLSPVVLASCNHTYWAVKPRHSRTGAPGPGLGASPGLTRYSYPRASHVLRFPGQAGSQWLGSQFDWQDDQPPQLGKGEVKP